MKGGPGSDDRLPCFPLFLVQIFFVGRYAFRMFAYSIFSFSFHLPGVGIFRFQHGTRAHIHIISMGLATETE